MTVFAIAWKNLIAHPLRSGLSILLLTLGAGLIFFILQVNHQVEQTLMRNLRGTDLVVGAKGSPLQLILSGIYHMDAPTGNIPISEVNRVLRHPMVASGIPLSYGDYARGYRIVGTDTAYLNLYEAAFEEGRVFRESMEAVIGAEVAQRTGWKVGDTFVGAHGTVSGHAHEDHPYRIVGILKPTGTVLDRLVTCSLSSVWDVHSTHEHADDHAHEHSHDHAHDDHHHHGHEDPVSWREQTDKEVTCVLVQFKNPMGMMQVPRFVNTQTNLQAAVPSVEINRLIELTALGTRTFRWLAYGIVVVAIISIFLSLWQALNERKRELALLRVLGASPWRLVTLLLTEGILLALLGTVLGMIVSRVGSYALVTFAPAAYPGLAGEGWLMQESWAALALILTGVLAAVGPAVQAFRLEIAKTLSRG